MDGESKTSSLREQPRRSTRHSSGLTSSPPAVRTTAKVKPRRSIVQPLKSNAPSERTLRRNAFLHMHQDYFLPLLPSNITQLGLARSKDISTVEYDSLNAPQNVRATMKPYQLDGLSFLGYMYRNGMSAILGDEMGLGKTLQTLALFQLIKDEGSTSHCPSLVICPLSVLSSWMNEARRWVPDLTVFRFHGPKAERDRLKADCRPGQQLFNSLDVLVTTYDTFVAEEGWFKRSFTWRYCVLDEGHKIKNDRSNVASSLQGLRAEYRLLLTGTPLQNNLHEMWALLHWLYPEVFTAATAHNFKTAFDLSKGRVQTGFMDDARHLLELIMLRRMKDSPGVDLGLPPKLEILLHVPLSPMQRFWYTRLLTKADNLLLDELFKGAKAKESVHSSIEQALLASHPSTDSSAVWDETRNIVQQAVQDEDEANVTGEWKKLMNLMMQLRKVCSHPYLLASARPDPYYLGEHVKTASGKFIILDKLVDELVIRKKTKILIFSQFTKTLDFCEDLLAIKGANDALPPFRVLRFDGSTGRARRNLAIRMFNDMSSEYRIMLISTRAGGLGINLASATNVVFMDEDWNPQITLQAEARAHRIGQTKPVTVYKLCSQGTVEEGILGRIRKKLYLSTKITESMQSIHLSGASKKRKRRSDSDNDELHLDTGALKSLVRRGAQTLTRPQVDITEMLRWDWDTVLENCQDRPAVSSSGQDVQDDEKLEQDWLNSMEKVETAVFEGKRLLKAEEKAAKDAGEELDRAGRRVGKNTTVMVNGFAINKASMSCGDWEAVPTLAGKDPRLAEPQKEKRAPVNNQEHCQRCFDGGNLVCCHACPRSYHHDCLSNQFKTKLKTFGNFHCPQHECADCQAKTTEAGGLIFRCRWCENGFCEDCLDWEKARLLGPTLPELEMLGFGEVQQAWYVECHACVEQWAASKADDRWIAIERARIQTDYDAFVTATTEGEEAGTSISPESISEVATPASGAELQNQGHTKIGLWDGGSPTSGRGSDK